jgi:hypothetical protein
VSRFVNPLEWLRQGFRAAPTLDVSDSAASREMLMPYLDELAYTRIPLLWQDSSIVLDGEEHGVQTYSGAVSIRTTWQAGAERNTTAVVRSLERLMELLQTLCRDGGSD